MWDEWVYVREIDAATLTRRREHLRLTKVETARRMYAHLESTALVSRETLVVTGSGSGMAWATESACRRAIDDLERGGRTFKELQYVEAMLTVLGIGFEDVGLDPNEVT